MFFSLFILIKTNCRLTDMDFFCSYIQLCFIDLTSSFLVFLFFVSFLVITVYLV